jgi:hypothetical protein
MSRGGASLVPKARPTSRRGGRPEPTPPASAVAHSRWWSRRGRCAPWCGWRASTRPPASIEPRSSRRARGATNNLLRALRRNAASSDGSTDTADGAKSPDKQRDLTGFPAEAMIEDSTRRGGRAAECAGFENRPPASVTSDASNSYDDPSNHLAAYLADAVQGHPELAEIARSWADLPAAVRAGMIAMIRTSRKG